MINKMAFTATENKGRLLENLIHTELKRRSKKIFYWKSKTGRELDFLVTEKGKPIEAIQACFELTSKNKERELQALIGAAQELKVKKITIITYNQEEAIKEKGKTIQIIPAWKWLLEN
jgi:predicted AAA+ superfamily ATPase